MNHHVTRSDVRRRLAMLAVAVAVAFSLASAWPAAQAQAKKSLTVNDYTKWRSIATEAISGDGRWVTYVLQQTNTTQPEAKPVLHVLNLETSKDVSVADATGGTFSPDSKWLAYQVDPGAAQRARAARAGSGSTSSGGATPSGQGPAAPPSPGGAPQTPAATPPAGGQGGQGQTGQGGRGANAPIPPRRVELRNLATGEVRSWQDIGSFTFNATSTHLFLQRRPAEAAGGGGRGGGATPPTPPPGAPGGGGRGGAAQLPSGPRGVDVILVNLATGRDQLLGSVGDIAFNRQGDLLAYTVDAPARTPTACS